MHKEVEFDQELVDLWRFLVEEEDEGYLPHSISHPILAGI
jgi:hypothetical protein